MLNATMERPSASPVFGNGERANRLKSTRFGGKLVNDYWDNLFHAKENGKKVSGTTAPTSALLPRP